MNTFTSTSINSYICNICNKNNSKYICPQCNISYCSLSCYQSHNENCTENFYKRNIDDNLHSYKISEEEKKNMLKILQVFFFLVFNYLLF
jgi:hypothetical protein